MEWQPIETAPKDGKRHMLFAAEFDRPGDWRIKMGYWSEGYKSWQLFGGSWKPTHWMPLPPPPSNAKRQTTNNLSTKAGLRQGTKYE